MIASDLGSFLCEELQFLQNVHVTAMAEPVALYTLNRVSVTSNTVLSNRRPEFILSATG